MKRRSGKKLGPWYLFAVGLLRPGMLAFTKRDWQGVENLAADILPDGSQRGIVVCPNHISWFDPLESAHFLYDNGRPPRYLGKESVFRVPVIGRIITGAGQIPVYRETVDAANSVRDAIGAVERGECVVIYPEGTITRDDQLWPMTGKILPRKTMHVRAGTPVDLDDLRGKPLDAALLQEATSRIIDAITALLEEIRGEHAPPERYDWKAHRDAEDPGTEGTQG